MFVDYHNNSIIQLASCREGKLEAQTNTVKLKIPNDKRAEVNCEDCKPILWIACEYLVHKELYSYAE